MTIDKKFNLLIDVSSSEGSTIKFYVPEPLQAEINSISRVLGYFYSTTSTNREPVEVIIKDYDRLIQESLVGLKDELITQVNRNIANVFTRSLDGCSIIIDGVVFDPTSPDRQKYLNDEELVEKFKGTLLFILALSRYLDKKTWMDIASDFITSFSPLELQASLKKSSKELPKELSVGSKVTLKRN